MAPGSQFIAADTLVMYHTVDQCSICSGAEMFATKQEARELGTATPEDIAGWPGNNASIEVVQIPLANMPCIS